MHDFGKSNNRLKISHNHWVQIREITLLEKTFDSYKFTNAENLKLYESR